MADGKYAGDGSSNFAPLTRRSLHIHNAIIELFSRPFIDIVYCQCKADETNTPGNSNAHYFPNCVNLSIMNVQQHYFNYVDILGPLRTPNGRPAPGGRKFKANLHNFRPKDRQELP